MVSEHRLEYLMDILVVCVSGENEIKELSGIVYGDHL
jgi:hypothetical protein